MSLLSEDRALLEGFRRGEPAALTRVYRAYSPRVLEYLSRGFRVRVGTTGGTSRVGALDLDAAHQETFVRAFAPKARAAYDGLRPYEGFLFAVARSAAVDTLRSAGKLARESVPLEDAPELGALPSEALSPEEGALASEVRELVARFLAQRTPAERTLAELRFGQGLSQELAGAQLRLSRQEARTHEAHLKRALLAFLRTEGWLDEGRRRTVALQARVASLLLLL